VRADARSEFDATDGKLKAAAKQQNEVATANLSMTFTTDGLMNLLYKAMNNNWQTRQ